MMAPTPFTEVGTRKPQVCRPGIENGSPHGRDEQIQLAFIHWDERRVFPQPASDVQDRTDGSLSAVRCSSWRASFLEEFS